MNTKNRQGDKKETRKEKEDRGERGERKASSMCHKIIHQAPKHFTSAIHEKSTTKVCLTYPPTARNQKIQMCLHTSQSYQTRSHPLNSTAQTVTVTLCRPNPDLFNSADRTICAILKLCHSSLSKSRLLPVAELLERLLLSF